MRVLVTGSSGLVGRPLCAALRSRGDSTVEYDLREPPEHDGRMGFEPCDIRDMNALRAATENVDGVVHLAAVSRCAPAEADPGFAHEINVGGTRGLLECLRSNGRSVWLIFASSREVYGEATSIPVSEATPVRPKAVYGLTKAQGERDVSRFVEERQGSAAILRFTNLYGSPWDYPDRVIPAFVTRARQNQLLEVRGPQQVLDFLHVNDAVRAIVEVAARFHSNSKGLEVINIASGKGCTLRALADDVVRLTESRSSIREVEPMAWTPSKFVADISRARHNLGWEPTISLAAGLGDLSAAYDAIEAKR